MHCIDLTVNYNFLNVFIYFIYILFYFKQNVDLMIFNHWIFPKNEKIVFGDKCQTSPIY